MFLKSGELVFLLLSVWGILINPEGLIGYYPGCAALGVFIYLISDRDNNSKKILYSSAGCVYPLPNLRRGTKYSAGLDIEAVDNLIVKKNERTLVPTNICMKIPNGYYGQIFSRSSLACKGIDVGAGVIDSDYDKEIKVLLINNSEEDFIVTKGDRIAQLVIIKIHMGYPSYVEEIAKSSSRNGGFGSTGK